MIKYNQALVTFFYATAKWMAKLMVNFNFNIICFPLYKLSVFLFLFPDQSCQLNNFRNTIGIWMGCIFEKVSIWMGMVPQTREVYEWVGYLNVQPHIRIKKWSSYPRTPLGLPSLRKLWLFALSLPTQVKMPLPRLF
jgi:hypothetical protein